MQYDLRVAVRMEDVTPPFQLLAQLPEVVDLAVEADDGRSVVRPDRLVATLQVQNLEAHCSQRDGGRSKRPLLVRPTMADRGRGTLNNKWIRKMRLMGKTGNPAQICR